jgi:excisionase family DNA binding protein
MENLVRKTSRKDQQLAKKVLATLGKGKSLKVGGNQKLVKLGGGVDRFIIKIFSLMAEGKSIAVLAAETELSTQEAAKLLNFSRPFVVKLLEEGKIRFRKVGTHRRVLLADVLFYKRAFIKGRREALAFLTQQAQDLKLGYE